MPCPICDEKPINCQCTEAELRMYYEIEELEEKVPRWIPVTERLPDHTNTVIVSDEHGVWFANRENKLAGWWDTCGGGMMENVTHWMELPEPPCCPDSTTPLGNTTPD